MIERILKHVSVSASTGCWNWTACKDRDGYGKITVDRSGKRAQRVSYEAFRGPIPSGLFTDHLCRNRACVNPWHLEPVTHTINQRRGNTISSQYFGKTHCKRGHEFTPENTKPTPKGFRSCRTCYQMKSIEWVDNNRDRNRANQLAHYHLNRDRILANRRERRANGKAN